MALEYGPFNGLENAWDAYDFAEYFKLFYGNGVFPNPSNNLQVVTNANMQTKVSVGVGFVEGHKIKNTSDFILQHDVADGVLKRIDRVVMRANFLQNKGEIIVKKGTPASSPVAPTLVRNTDYYELALADVLINNGATVITQANITDQRLNTALCGVVATNITQLDTTTLALQYQAAFEQMTIDQQQEFETWLDALDDILDENVAATLANRLLTVEGDVSDIDTQLTQHSAQITTLQNNTQKATQAEAQAGTNNAKVMTPLRVNEAVTSHPTVADLVSRWGKLCKTITNWDTTVENGLYMGTKATGMPNTGTPDGWMMGEVIAHNDLFVNQRIISFTDGIVCREFQRNRINGVWNEWIETTPQKVLTEIESLKSSVSNGKSQVAAAITGKGVTTAADATFAMMATNISQITTGPKVASGTIGAPNLVTVTLQNGSTESGLGLVTVSGLSFTPTKIKIYRNDGTYFYETNYDASNPSPFNGVLMSTFTNNAHNNRVLNVNPNTSPCYVRQGGFALPVQTQGQTYNWYAEG